jgi:hypothetical protein
VLVQTYGYVPRSSCLQTDHIAGTVETMYACTQVYIHMHIHRCIHMYVHMYIFTYAYTYKDTYECMYIYIDKSLQELMNINVHIYLYI